MLNFNDMPDDIKSLIFSFNRKSISAEINKNKIKYDVCMRELHNHSAENIYSYSARDTLYEYFKEKIFFGISDFSLKKDENNEVYFMQKGDMSLDALYSRDLSYVYYSLDDMMNENTEKAIFLNKKCNYDPLEEGYERYINDF